MDIVALEEIKRVKYRYLRCVDQKRWDELAEVLTEDAVAAYGTPALGRELTFTGRDEILAFLKGALDTPDLITVHFAGQPEIEIDGDVAEGTWLFSDEVIALEHRQMIKGVAFYEDRYVRGADGRWRIQRTGYERTYEMILSLDDLPSLRITAGAGALAVDQG